MKWTTVRSSPAHDFRFFQVRTLTRQSPSGIIHDFVVIDSVDWVVVIALTADNQVVMVEQFRHGTNTIELEIPGGMIDPEDPSPIAAGERELREETGYSGDQAQILATVSPNPAFMSNDCQIIVVQNCVRRHETAFDHTEQIATSLVPVDEINRLVAEGRIRHSLVLVALYHFDLWRRGFRRHASLPIRSGPPSPLRGERAG